MEPVKFLHPTGNSFDQFGAGGGRGGGGCQDSPLCPKSSRTRLDLHMLIWRTVAI